MNITRLNNSLVLKKSGLDVELVAVDRVKKHLLSVFEGADPVINKFPDILVLTIPEHQLSVTIQSGVIILSVDVQKGTDLTQQLIQLTQKIDNEFNEYDLKAYGINNRFLLEDIDPAKLHEYFNFSKFEKNGVFNADALRLPSLTVLEKVDESKKRVINFTLFVSQKTDEYLGNGEMFTNLHHEAEELPEYSAIQEAVEAEIAAVAEKAGRLL